MSDVVMRSATQDDREWIQTLLSSHKDLAGSFYWSWQSFLKHPDRHRWLVAEQDESPLGTIHFYLSPKKHAWCIAEIMVRPSAKRKGIGRLLTEQVPLPTVLTTNTDNEESHPFYEKLGFVRDGVSATRKGRPLIIYRKTAPPGEECAAS